MEGSRSGRDAVEVPFNRVKSAFVAAFGITLLAGGGWLIGAILGNQMLAATLGSLGLVLGIVLSIDYALVALAGAALVIGRDGFEVRLPLGRRLALPWRDVTRVATRASAVAQEGVVGRYVETEIRDGGGAGPRTGAPGAAGSLPAGAQYATKTIAIGVRPGWREAGNQVPLSIFFAGSRDDVINLNPLVLGQPAFEVIEVMEHMRRAAGR